MNEIMIMTMFGYLILDFWIVHVFLHVFIHIF